jgi:TolB protein
MVLRNGVRLAGPAAAIAFGAAGTLSRPKVVSKGPCSAGLAGLTNSDAVEMAPAWPPDGARIALSLNRDGDHEIHVMNAHGSGLVQLTDNQDQDINPSWSPDGRYLSFTNDPPQNADIYIISVDGLLLLPLTDHPATDFGASWGR